MPTDLEIAFPTLSDHDLAALRARGRERAVDAGEILYSAGDTVVGFFVVLEGEVEVVDGVGEDARFITTVTPGQFTGEGRASSPGAQRS